MATKKHSASSGAPLNSTVDANPADQDSVRRDLARRASAEIDALQRMLARETVASEDAIELELVLLPTLRRIGDLANVCMSVTGTEGQRGTEELSAVVYGEQEAEHA